MSCRGLHSGRGSKGAPGTVLDFSAQSPLGVPLHGNLLHSEDKGHFYEFNGLLLIRSSTYA